MNYLSYLSRLFRSAFKFRFFTSINIFGLAVGLFITMFLLVYLQFEFSYDKHFKDADRICRVLSVTGENGDEIQPGCSGDLAHRLMRDVPEVEVATRLLNSGVINFKSEDSGQMGIRVYEVDSAFLQVFDFRPVYGQLEGALSMLGSSVITRTTAERYFGKGVDPIGKTLTVYGAGNICQIAAVIEDVPADTHFKFDILLLRPSDRWGGFGYYTYLKFKPGMDIESGITKCNRVNRELLEETQGLWRKGKYGGITEPLTDIHVFTRSAYDLTPTASMYNLIFVVLVVIFILGIAISNFVSLYIIQGEQKALEISIRKTNGASRTEIIRLLFGETFLVTLMAFVLAVGLFYGFSARIATLLDFHLPENTGMTWELWGEFLLLFIVLGFVVGGYPAYYLSKFSPKALLQKSDVRRYRLTATSVIIQFSVVVFCVSSLFVIWRQLDYVKNLSLGFQPENIIEVRVDIPYKYYKVVKTELLQYSFIQDVTVSYGNPMEGSYHVPVRRLDQGRDELTWVNGQRIGPGYLEFYKINLLKGHDFMQDVDTNRNVILSESAVRSLGLKDDPVGQKIYYAGGEPWTVIGVVGDVLASAHRKVEGGLYTSNDSYYMHLAVKFDPDKYMEARQLLLNALDRYYPGLPFAVVLTTDKVQKQYAQDRVTSSILMSGTVLAVVLALLGLLALSAFVSQQKRKEISVRRVMGAQVNEIVYGLNRYILVRVIPAIPIGLILSGYAMNRWIQNFEYAKPLSWWVFALAVLTTLGIVLLTIFYQSWRAANMNPAEALKGD